MTTSCPDPAQLQELVNGTLSTEGEAELTAHLDSCISCRQKLEALSGEEFRLVGPVAEGSGPSPDGEPALAAVMAQLQKPSGEEWPTLPPLAPPAQPGNLGRLGQYEVLSVVGRGGMGIVLKARDEILDRIVAIKVMAPQLATSAAARQRFLREARAAAAIRDEHVVDIHAVQEHDGLPYMVMEYINGISLQERLKRKGPVELREVLRIGMQAAKGLAAAHSQGLVHRDIKPSNILLENHVERVKISDFGLARAVDDASQTQSGVVAGTPEYMAPEQAKGEIVDHRADLFSLGSVLYAMCAGRPPFRAHGALAVLKRVSEDTPRSLRAINPEIPDWLEAIIARLHAKSPADRIQTAAEVAELLGRHLAHLQQGNEVIHVSSVPAGRARWKRASRILALLLLLAIAVLGATVVASWLHQRRDEAQSPDAADRTVQQAPPWQPLAPLTAEELAKLPSPLDALKREAMELPQDAPPELLALLGDVPRFRLTGDWACHWMAQTRDGRLLGVPHGCNIELFEAQTGKLLRTLTGHTTRAYRPDFSPDGKRLASGEDANILCVWDVATGQVELTLKEPKAPIWCVAYDPGGKRLVSGDASGTVHVWDAEGRLLKSFQAHDLAMNHLAFSPDGKRLATVSLDGSCKVWDPDKWQEVRSLPGNGQAFDAVAWSRDGKLLAAGDDRNDGRVVIWNADTYEVLHTLKTPGKGLLAFTPDGHTLLTARHDCSRGERHGFTRWNVATAAQEKSCELPSSGGTCVYFRLSPDGGTVFVAQHDAVDNQLRAYDATTGQELIPRQGHSGAVLSVAFSPNGRTLVSGSSDGTARLWDLAGWQPGEPLPPVRTLEGHTNEVWSVSFSPDGKLLASGGRDGWIFLWDAASGSKIHVLAGHSPAWANLTFSPDGRTLAAGGQHGTVNRWDVSSAQPKEPWRWHVGEVRPVAFSPDGRLMASGGKDNTVQLLDARTGQRLHTFRGRTFFTNVAFSPDSRTLAAVSESPDATLRLLNLQTKGERILTGHTDHVFGLSFHPGGKLLATTSLDRTVRLWDGSPPGKELRSFDFRSSGPIYCVAFTPEGRYLAVGLQNGTIVILRVAP
jgi:serine/threonine-protein kinase